MMTDNPSKSASMLVLLGDDVAAGVMKHLNEVEI